MTGWRVTYRVLWAGFLLAAALNVLHVRAGVLTSYLADVVLPALLYVASRGLVSGARPLPIVRWIGRTPERAASVWFLASAATEVSQRFFPLGMFAGRFDPWDLVAFGVGIGGCYVADRWGHTVHAV
jgi:hypothetical protein